jgi:hypothetical protein
VFACPVKRGYRLYNWLGNCSSINLGWRLLLCKVTVMRYHGHVFWIKK